VRLTSESRSTGVATASHRHRGLLAEIRENRLLSRWGDLLPRPAGAPRTVHESDAELLPLPGGGTLALTVDTVAEEIERGLYRRPFTAGRTAAVASLSDLAAVGADPLGLLLAVTLPGVDSGAVQEEVARGVSEACTSAGTCVLGGDTNFGPQLTVATVGAGLVPAGIVPMSRTGMKAGDHLFASGLLGLGGALAAARWLSSATRCLSPAAGGFGEADYRPRVTLPFGRALRGVASACMDTSDGLVATLDQLARLNGLALRIERPLAELLGPEARRAAQDLGLPPFALLAGQHGEFELVFSVPEASLPRLERTGLQPVFLGRAEAGAGLLFGSQPVDGARVRNLWDETGGDVRAYARGLVALDPERSR
jgi:thiamine-monophosphate kinase